MIVVRQNSDAAKGAFRSSSLGGGRRRCHEELAARGPNHPLPLAIYSLRVTLGGMIHFLIALALVVALSLALRGPDRWPEPLSLGVGILLLFLAGWAVTSVVSFVNVAFRDTQHILEIAFQILFYLTPIIYPVEVLAPTRVGWVLSCNPLLPFLDLVRAPLIQGAAAPAATWAAASVIALAVGLGLSIVGLGCAHTKTTVAANVPEPPAGASPPTDRPPPGEGQGHAHHAEPTETSGIPVANAGSFVGASIVAYCPSHTDAFSN